MEKQPDKEEDKGKSYYKERKKTKDMNNCLRLCLK